MKKPLLFLLILAAGWGIFLRNSSVPAPADGIRLAEIPEQTATFVAPWKEGEFEIRPLARYRIKARVLAKKRYYLQDISGLAPYDLALGWGDMSDSAVLAHISISQSGRWYEYYYDGTCPITQSAIATQSANVHCLPADSTVRRALGGLRVNAFVELKGFWSKCKRTARTVRGAARWSGTMKGPGPAKFSGSRMSSLRIPSGRRYPFAISQLEKETANPGSGGRVLPSFSGIDNEAKFRPLETEL